MIRQATPLALKPGERVTIKMLAAHLGLSVAAVSRILNGSPAAKSIAPEVTARVFKAAEELKYKPNVFARSLRSRRSYTVGVMMAEASEGYATLVLSGIEQKLMEEGYFYFVVSHHYSAERIAEYGELLMARAIEGLVAVDTSFKTKFPIPTVTVSGHHEPQGVVNILLDEQKAAQLALEHLYKLGHRKICCMRGQAYTSDANIRWKSIEESMQRLGLELPSVRIMQLEEVDNTPEPGYAATKRLIATKKPFTAIFAFNDMAAIGCIRALREANLRVPEDVSVVGFDDIQTAAYITPGLTTVRQPLREMGLLAAQSVLRLIQFPKDPIATANQLIVSPELVIRGSTGIARKL